MHLFGSNLRRWEFWKELISFRSFVIVSPVFLLTVKHWTNLVVLIVFVGSLFFLLRKKEVSRQDTDVLKRWRWIIALTLTGPLLAVGMGQLLRGEFYPPNFDAPLRIALCVPVFIAISRGWLNKEGNEPIVYLWMKFVIPATLIWTFLERSSWTISWGDNIITTYFVDPLTFGSLTLLFSLLSFTALTFFWSSYNYINRLFICICITIGLYLSVMSGSRTGWPILPIFFYLWIRMFAVDEYGIFKASLITIVVLICILLFIPIQPVLVDKIKLGFNELINYNWNSINENNSISMRVSLYRMAAYYFFQNPINGWGDLGWMSIKDSAEITLFATDFTKDFAKNGFHNEVLTSAVRSGVWGLCSSLALLFVPIYFSKFIRTKTIDKQMDFHTLCLSVLMTHLLVAGMTTEVTNLVFLASFIGLSLSVFLGETLAKSII